VVLAFCRQLVDLVIFRVTADNTLIYFSYISHSITSESPRITKNNAVKPMGKKPEKLACKPQCECRQYDGIQNKEQISDEA
jgi:hypothetical protein